MKLFRSVGLAFGLLITMQAFSQPAIDSLERMLEQPLPDTARVKALNQLAFLYWNQDPDKMSVLAREAAELAQRINYPLGEGNAYQNLATADELRGDIINSFENNFKSIRIFLELENVERLAVAYSNLAISYYKIDNLELALENIHEALAYGLEANDTSLLINNLTFVASVHSDLNNPELAIAELHKVRELEMKFAPNQVQGYTSFNLANAHWKLDNNDSTSYYFVQSAQLGKKHLDYHLVQVSYLKLSKLMYEQEDYVRFKQYLDSSAAIIPLETYTDNQFEWLEFTIQYALDRNKLEEAKSLAWRGLHLAHAVKSPYSQSDFSRYLSEVHAAQNNVDSAYFYLNESNRFESIASKERNFHKAAMSNFNFRMNRQLKEQDLLRLQLMDEAKRRQDRERLLIISVIIIVAFGVAGAALVRLYRQRKSLSEKLLLANADLTASVQQVKQLNQEMQTMTHAIIHDLRSPFVSLEYLLRYMKGTHTSDEDQMLLDNGLKEARKGQAFVSQLLEDQSARLSKQHQPDAFAIRDLIEELETHFTHQLKSKQIMLHTSFGSAEVRINRETVYRILDNLISNAIKFSPEHKRVWLSADVVDSKLKLTVKDEGPGFSDADRQKLFVPFEKLSAQTTAGESSHGVGLSTVHMLVKQLGGTIELNSAAGEGATFTVTIPVASVKSELSSALVG